ncbi:hypothetical protein OSTOST_15039, partial [Ostertagia ostertagi]
FIPLRFNKRLHWLPVRIQQVAIRTSTKDLQDSRQQPLKTSEQLVCNMPKSSGDGTASAHPAQLEVVLQTMLQQLQFQHEEMKMLFASLAPTKDGMVDNQKLLYDQLNKDVEKFVYDEESGYTFDYWYRRYGHIIEASSIPEDKKRDFILLKLEDSAYRKYADDVLPSQPHEIDFATTVRKLQKLFASKKTLIRRRYECLRISCPALTSDYVPFRDYANTIKRMDEEASLKEMDYTALKTLQFVAGLQDPSLREVRLRMLRRLDTQAEDAPLTIEDLVAECENFTALKMDNANMGTSHDVHAVQKKKVKCFKCGGPHYRNVCPLLANMPKMSNQIPKKPRRQHNRRRRNQCKNIATFAAENARTYINVDTADGSPMKIDGRFSTGFSVKDRTTGKQFRGNGYCYVTESTNLLGLEWCVQLPAYKELQEKYHCRMVSEADTIRSSLVGDLKKQYAEIFKCELGRCKKRKAKTPCTSTPAQLSPAELFLGRQIRTTLTLLEETTEGGKGPRNAKMETQFNRHHGARERSYKIGEPVWIRDYRPGHKPWIMAHVKSRVGRVLYDVLTEQGQLWRRHANQMRARPKENATDEEIPTTDEHLWSEDREHGSKEAQHKEEAETTADSENDALDRIESTALPRTPDRWNRHRNRRPPERLQVNPKMKTYTETSAYVLQKSVFAFIICIEKFEDVYNCKTEIFFHSQF